MAGGTLKQLVTREMLGNGRRSYSNQDALDICLQMARGLRCGRQLGLCVCALLQLKHSLASHDGRHFKGNCVVNIYCQPGL
jgi:hypothetical protein